MKFLGIVLFVCPLMAQVNNAGMLPSSLAPSSLVSSSLVSSSLVEVQPGAAPRPLTATANYLGEAPKNDGKRLYQWSLVAVAAGNAADTFSSWGHAEANPFLANPGSTFDARSMLLKSAFIGTSFVIEHWALRHNPRLYRSFAWMNFAIGGVLGGVAAHNTTLH